MGFLSILGTKNGIIGLVIALAVISIGIYIKILKSNVARLEAENETLVTRLDVSQASVKLLQNAIGDQNKAIENIKKDADQRVAKNADEVKKAQTLADEHKRRADELLTSQPDPALSKCDAANQLINKEIKK